MPDISMCMNDTCPLKETCYRYQARASHYQTYSFFEPDEKGECEYHWPIEIKEEKV